MCVDHEQNVLTKGVKEPMILSHIIELGGSYGITCEREEEMPTRLKTPSAVSFVTICEKRVDAVSGAGRVTALCLSGAVLETQAPLERYANLQMDIGGKMFAKVTNRLENGWLLRSTARPPEFERWYSDQKGAQSAVCAEINSKEIKT